MTYPKASGAGRVTASIPVFVPYAWTTGSRRSAGTSAERPPLPETAVTASRQPAIRLSWALCDGTVREVVEAAPERATAAVPAWIEDTVAVIRYGSGGERRVRPAHGVVAARFRHHRARSRTPLHDHVSSSFEAHRAAFTA